MTNSSANLTIHDFYTRLAERVSDHNARLVLNSALATSGVKQDERQALGIEEARAICLALINKGGPAFQVGKSVYQTLQ